MADSMPAMKVGGGRPWINECSLCRAEVVLQDRVYLQANPFIPNLKKSGTDLLEEMNFLRRKKLTTMKDFLCSHCGDLLTDYARATQAMNNLDELLHARTVQYAKFHRVKTKRSTDPTEANYCKDCMKIAQLCPNVVSEEISTLSHHLNALRWKDLLICLFTSTGYMQSSILDALQMQVDMELKKWEEQNKSDLGLVNDLDQLFVSLINDCPILYAMIRGISDVKVNYQYGDFQRKHNVRTIRAINLFRMILCSRHSSTHGQYILKRNSLAMVQKKCDLELLDKFSDLGWCHNKEDTQKIINVFLSNYDWNIMEDKSAEEIALLDVNAAAPEEVASTSREDGGDDSFTDTHDQFECQLCSVHLPTATEMKHHLTTAHKGNAEDRDNTVDDSSGDTDDQFECEFCTMRLPTAREMKDHMTTVHKEKLTITTTNAGKRKASDTLQEFFSSKRFRNVESILTDLTGPNIDGNKEKGHSNNETTHQSKEAASCEEEQQLGGGIGQDVEMSVTIKVPDFAEDDDDDYPVSRSDSPASDISNLFEPLDVKSFNINALSSLDFQMLDQQAGGEHVGHSTPGTSVLHEKESGQPMNEMNSFYDEPPNNETTLPPKQHTRLKESSILDAEHGHEGTALYCYESDDDLGEDKLCEDKTHVPSDGAMVSSDVDLDEVGGDVEDGKLYCKDSDGSSDEGDSPVFDGGSNEEVAVYDPTYSCNLQNDIDLGGQRNFHESMKSESNVSEELITGVDAPVDSSNTLGASVMEGAYGSVNKDGDSERSSDEEASAHTCEKCHKMYPLSRLQNHFCTKEEAKHRPFNCSFCSRYFRTVKNRDQHKCFSRCHVCGRHYTSRDGMMRHGSTHQHECKYCKYYLNTKEDQDSHQKLHLGGKHCFCSTCKEPFVDADDRRTHVCHQKGAYRCKTCGAQWRTCTEFLAHEEQHTRVRVRNVARKSMRETDSSVIQYQTPDVYKCRYLPCEMTFKKRNQREIHEAKHIIYCDPCMFLFRTDEAYVEHELRVHLKYFVYKCRDPSCELLCSSEEARDRHEEIHWVFCYFCEELFSSGEEYADHLLNVHEKKKELVCFHCNKVFDMVEELKMHHQTQLHLLMVQRRYPLCDTNYLQYKTKEWKECKYCDKLFDQEETCRVHEETHSLVCRFCGQERPTFNNLLFHVQIHKSKRLYCCIKCGLNFSSRSDLAQHEGLHEPFFCSVCKVDFRSAYDIAVHEILHDNGKKDALQGGFTTYKDVTVYISESEIGDIVTLQSDESTSDPLAANLLQTAAIWSATLENLFGNRHSEIDSEVVNVSNILQARKLFTKLGIMEKVDQSATRNDKKATNTAAGDSVIPYKNLMRVVPGGHSCYVCNMTFIDQLALLQHLRLYHIMCEKCKIWCANWKDKLVHLVTKHGYQWLSHISSSVFQALSQLSWRTKSKTKEKKIISQKKKKNTAKKRKFPEIRLPKSIEKIGTKMKGDRREKVVVNWMKGVNKMSPQEKLLAKRRFVRLLKRMKTAQVVLTKMNKFPTGTVILENDFVGSDESEKTIIPSASTLPNNGAGLCSETVPIMKTTKVDGDSKEEGVGNIKVEDINLRQMSQSDRGIIGNGQEISTVKVKKEVHPESQDGLEDKTYRREVIPSKDAGDEVEGVRQVIKMENGSVDSINNSNISKCEKIIKQDSATSSKTLDSNLKSDNQSKENISGHSGNQDEESTLKTMTISYPDGSVRTIQINISNQVYLELLKNKSSSSRTATISKKNSSGEGCKNSSKDDHNPRYEVHSKGSDAKSTSERNDTSRNFIANDSSLKSCTSEENCSKEASQTSSGETRKTCLPLDTQKDEIFNDAELKGIPGEKENHCGISIQGDDAHYPHGTEKPSCQGSRSLILAGESLRKGNIVPNTQHLLENVQEHMEEPCSSGRSSSLMITRECTSCDNGNTLTNKLDSLVNSQVEIREPCSTGSSSSMVARESVNVDNGNTVTNMRDSLVNSQEEMKEFCSPGNSSSTIGRQPVSCDKVDTVTNTDALVNNQEEMNCDSSEESVFKTALI